MNYGEILNLRGTFNKEKIENTDKKVSNINVPNFEYKSNDGYLELSEDEKNQVEIKKKSIAKKIANYYMSCIDINWYKNIKNKALKSILEANKINDIVWEMVYKTCYYGSTFTLVVKINGFTRLFVIDSQKSIFFVSSGNKVLSYASLFVITDGSLSLPFFFYASKKTNQLNAIELKGTQFDTLQTFFNNKNTTQKDFQTFLLKITPNSEATDANDFGLPITWNYFNTLKEDNFVESNRYLVHLVRNEKQIWEDGDFSGNKLFIRQNTLAPNKPSWLDKFTRLFRKPVVSLNNDDFELNARTGLGKYQPQSGVSQVQQLLMRNKWAQAEAFKKSNYFINSNTKGTAQQHTLEVALDNIDAYLFQNKVNETITKNLTFLFKTIAPNYKEDLPLNFKNYLFNLIKEINDTQPTQTTVNESGNVEKVDNESK